MNKPGTILAALCLFAGLFSGSVFCAEISEPSADNIQEIIRDEIVETILKERDIQKPGVHTVYDYKSTVKIPVKISIKDTGIGIPPADLSNIFIRFWRGNTNILEGNGIGLYLCKQIISLQHGYILVNSTVNSGSEFEIYIPL